MCWKFGHFGALDLSKAVVEDDEDLPELQLDKPVTKKEHTAYETVVTSTKIGKMLEILTNIRENNEYAKTVIFTQFTTYVSVYC